MRKDATVTIEPRPQTKTANRVGCPSCGEKGKRVSTVTLEALLEEEFAKSWTADNHSCRGATGEGCKPINGETAWRFCESRDCDVVYFSEEGDTTFTKSQLKVPVGVKEEAGERPLCYCFGHSVASIKKEFRTKSQSKALEDIRTKMKDPGCRCATENPSGSCCLGSVAKGINIAQVELEASEVQPSATPSKPPYNRGEMIAKIGTVVSAVMASACCWLPLILLAVGVSGAGVASTLQAYRPLFMAVTFAFLGAAFYFTARPRKARDGGQACCGSEGAEVGDCSAPAIKGNRFKMMTVNQAILWVVAVLAVAFLFFPNYAGLIIAAGDDNIVTSDMHRAVVKIEGMTCVGCAAVAEKAIRGVPGVLVVRVSHEKGEADVATEACCPMPTAEILTALEKAGYSGVLSHEANHTR